jgi:periplasmic divalent cation tolerance protein
MKPAQTCAVVLVTAPDLTVARKLVRVVLTARLAACGNLIPKLESHYWWEGKIDTSAEVLILFKTKVKALEALEQLILQHHPYDTPEIIALNLGRGTPRYLAWIEECVALNPQH